MLEICLEEIYLLKGHVYERIPLRISSIPIWYLLFPVATFLQLGISKAIRLNANQYSFLSNNKFNNLTYTDDKRRSNIRLVLSSKCRQCVKRKNCGQWLGFLSSFIIQLLALPSFILWQLSLPPELKAFQETIQRRNIKQCFEDGF